MSSTTTFAGSIVSGIVGAALIFGGAMGYAVRLLFDFTAQ